MTKNSKDFLTSPNLPYKGPRQGEGKEKVGHTQKMKGRTRSNPERPYLIAREKMMRNLIPERNHWEMTGENVKY